MAFKMMIAQLKCYNTHCNLCALALGLTSLPHPNATPSTLNYLLQHSLYSNQATV